MENNSSNVRIPHLSGVPQGDVVGNLCDEHSLLTKNSTQTEDLSNPDNDNSKLAEDINNFGITGLDVNANEFVEVMKEESVKSVESDNSDENLHKETDTEFVYDELQKSKASNQSAFLQPLLLQPPSCDADKKDSQKMQNDENLFLKTSTSKMSDLATPCMLCDYVEPDMYQKSGRDEYLCHLIVEHLLVIADVKLIADLQSYAVYWRKRFAEGSLDEFCSKIRTNTGAKDIDKSEDYYLLCDVLPEDKKLREELQLTQLKKLLLRQEFERKDETFSRMCPFCTKFFQGNRIILFNHMNEDHNFNIGHPDNIVNVREFMDEIQVKLDALQCLYCEKVFKDRASLREHMRKKAHRRLNPKNKDYDKYYIINYLELGKNWETLQGESEKLDSTSE
ncbi:unnamed protein product [Clavelina lepadiformis]|uniref:C2H2-type domain-containing protein n=1 Tax=Clavelina lepadiformis TaxID=159417 RepID=A0ABP0GDG5_CLALP